ncbi:MAG: response regulator transcription factor [Chloroflexota bacterium]|nr:response regulator transcription factor [Dehalococcoidia bacterium]MDW8252960.1 response regulator transcription factor [Chloroflexota bacterium]
MPRDESAAAPRAPEGDRARVLIVDDQPRTRQALAQLLEDHPRLAVVGGAATAEEALAQVASLEPDVVLLELYLGGADGVAIIAEIRRLRPTAKVVVLTMSEDDNDLLRAVMAGASGYVIKSADISSLVTSLEWVVAGEAALSRALTARLVNRLRDAAFQLRAEGALERSVPRARLERLSPREREVLALITRGASNRQIARALGLSEHTVRTHVTNILAKLGLENRVQAAAAAIRLDFLSSAGSASSPSSSSEPAASPE